MTTEVRALLEAHASSAGQARRVVRAALRDWAVDDDLTEDVVLLTSEVVTNAMLHARTAAELVVRRGDATIRVEVIDGAGSTPAGAFDAGPLALSGRGLQMVAAMSQSWGVEPRDNGKAVWFELGLPARQDA